MSAQELQQMQQQYDMQLKKCSAIRSAFTQEFEKRTLLLQLLEQQAKQGIENQTRMERIIKEWTANTIHTQDILTRIEVSNICPGHQYIHHPTFLFHDDCRLH